ncbi:hypothetical protein [Haloarcula argentinensis]|uniref:Uncharacterized protein n=1 Tax=Haloarcula argentinensis TaxID=43776 RepID=A0ABU2F7I8_HALAR|nr:hypothetical protein [Haloarcula argentinensis]MDS0256015.1 hypothetical protein [Haloarcula argentinensis]
MSADQPTLGDYAESEGTTETVETNYVGAPDDGHLYEVSEIDDYWRGTRKLDGSGYWPIHSLVPAGRLTIVLDDSDDCVDRGWSGEDPLQTGVYLTGRGDISGTHPPHPMAIDDEWLQFGAEACVRAATRICPDKDIVAIRKGSWGATLLVTVRDGERTDLYNGTNADNPAAYPNEQPELFCGFYHIRQDSPPVNVYTECEAPRLDLADLDQFSDD